MPTTTARKISLAFAGGLGALAVTAIAALIAMQRLATDRALVAHTYDVRGELRTLDAELREAKSNVRSFLLTGDSAYVVRYLDSVDSAEGAFASLRELTADNPLQQRRLDSLRPVLEQRVRSLGLTASLRAEVARGTPPAVVGQLAEGEQLAQRVTSSISALDSVERTLLLRRAAAQSETEVAARIVVIVLGVLGLGLAGAMYRSIGRDLARRARAEEALRESEAKFAGILAIAADAIITVDARQRIVHFNHGAEQIFGYPEDEIVGQPLDVLIPRRFVPAHRGYVDEFARSPEMARRMGHRRQVSGVRSNGEEFPAEASISKLTTPRGVLFTVVLRDVTEQKRHERGEHLLAEAGRRLVSTLDYDEVLRLAVQIPVPDLGDWCVLDVVERSDDEGMKIRRVTSRHPVPETDAALRAIEAHGLDEDSPSRVLDILRTRRPELIASVSTDWIEAHTEPDQLSAIHPLDARSLILVPLLSADRGIGVLSIGASSSRPPLDESDRALAEALAGRVTLAIENARHFRLARRATAARDEVLSVVSHDLRNPLSAVTMYARVLLDHPPTTETERRPLYQSVLDAADWMHRLMQDLLDAASIEAGRLSVEMEPQSVEQLIEASVHMFQARADSLGVRLVVDLDGSAPIVEADDARVQQVLGNLIGNALKYTPSGGTITIGAEPRAEEVVLWVRDTGAGIAPQHLPHLFDRFWHVRGASRTRGSGLGLAIARGIVAAHGGRIWVDSTPGEGSTFWFTLPRAAVGARDELPDASTHRGAPA